MCFDYMRNRKKWRKTERENEIEREWEKKRTHDFCEEWSKKKCFTYVPRVSAIKLLINLTLESVNGVQTRRSYSCISLLTTFFFQLLLLLPLPVLLLLLLLLLLVLLFHAKCKAIYCDRKTNAYKVHVAVYLHRCESKSGQIAFCNTRMADEC